MGHPEIKNKTPFAVEVVFLTDEEGRPLWVPLIQATYRIEDTVLWSGRKSISYRDGRRVLG